jgi:hypothetical protein
LVVATCIDRKRRILLATPLVTIPLLCGGGYVAHRYHRFRTAENALRQAEEAEVGGSNAVGQMTILTGRIERFA